MKEKALENIVGKAENAGYHHFLLFSQCFLTYQKKNFIRATLKLLSTNAFNIDRSKILSCGKGLIL